MFNLLQNRIRVLADEGSDTTGVIVENKLQGYGGLSNHITSEPPESPEDPPIEIPPTVHNHIVFIKEMAVEVEIDGASYLVMTVDAIAGYITG